MTAPLPQGWQVKDLDPDTFYTPEQVAPVAGFTKNEFRGYCKESGHYTKLAKSRIMVVQDDVKAIVKWVRERNATKAADPDNDPWAK